MLRVLKAMRSAPAIFGAILVLLAAVGAGAATYRFTTLKELAGRADGIVKVRVLERVYEESTADARLLYTNVSVALQNCWKGEFPEKFDIRVPGGIQGDRISYVQGAADFHVGEEAIVFLHKSEKGWIVQDLGLGKFDIVERARKPFVENPLTAQILDQDEAKNEKRDPILCSVPYDDFAALISAYVENREAPSVTAAPALAAVQSAAFSTSALCADANSARAAAPNRSIWIGMGICALAAVVSLVLLKRYRSRVAMVVLAVTLTLGAAIPACAFVPLPGSPIWDLDTPVINLVANQRILWREGRDSAQFAGAMGIVAAAFQSWEDISDSRLAFTRGGVVSANTSHDGSDGVNAIAFQSDLDENFSAFVLAITFFQIHGDPLRFANADIIFNDRDFNWNSGQSQPTVRPVALHEIGHMIGLGHTKDRKTIMFPIDQEIQNLTADELSAARALYPEPISTNGPVTIASASPVSGAPGLNVSFSGTESHPGPQNSQIMTYNWEFGDGATGTGSILSHVYTVRGSYLAKLTTTDANNNSTHDTVRISVGDSVTVNSGAFKVNFKAIGSDNFTAVISSPALFNFNIGKTAPITSQLNVGGIQGTFTYDPRIRRSTTPFNLKLSIVDKKGTLSMKLAGDLREAMYQSGVLNDTISSGTAYVPLVVDLGTSGVFLSTELKMLYKSSKGKGASGKTEKAHAGRS